MASFRGLEILWALFLSLDATSQQSVIVENPVFARRGESAELSCTYSTSATQGFTLEWRYAAPGTPAIQAERVLYYNGQLYWVGSWERKAALFHNPPVHGTASLRIFNVQPSDTGLYICDVTNPNDWSGSGQGLVNFTVLMPPSTPECKLNGNPYLGTDVTLTCKSSVGLPAPVYSWNREKNAAPLSLDNMVEDQQTGSLVLRNLSAPFSGTYTCTATNELGAAACSVAVRVSYISNAFIIGSAVMGTFIALLLLGAVVAYFFWYKKRKPKATEENHELRGDHTQSTVRFASPEPEDSLLNRHIERQDDLRPPQSSLLV